MAADGCTDFAADASPGASRLGNPKLLDRVVANLCDIQRGSGLQKTLAIGELILTHFYGGNPSEWRDRRRNKNNSIRRLAARDDCPFSRSALNEAVTVYVASRTLPCVLTFGHIGAGHVAAVLKLPQDEREAMLVRAEREQMGIREFRRIVVKFRRTDGERRGRPAKDPEDRLVSALGEGLEQVRQHILLLSGSLRVPGAVQERLTNLARELANVATDLELLGRSRSTGESCAEVQGRMAKTGRAVVTERSDTSAPDAAVAIGDRALAS
jgi:hypothetical protein